MILLRSWPAAPTKGCPLASSSAPGASPTKHKSTLPPPRPNTVCVRVLANSAQRQQPATSCASICSAWRRSSSGTEDAGGATGSSTNKPDVGAVDVVAGGTDNGGAAGSHSTPAS